MKTSVRPSYLLILVAAVGIADCLWLQPRVIFSCSRRVNWYADLVTGRWVSDRRSPTCAGPNRTSALEFCKRVYSGLPVISVAKEGRPVKLKICTQNTESSPVCRIGTAFPSGCLIQNVCTDALPNGYVTKKQSHLVNGKFFVTLLHYSCNDGFALVGHSIRSCSLYQNITRFHPTQRPVCRRVCPNPVPAVPLYGSVSLQVDSRTDDWTALYNISCPKGFALNGSLVRTCPNNTVWEQPEPSCDLVAFPLDKESCTFVNKNGIRDNCTYRNSQKNDLNWAVETGGRPRQILPQIGLPDVYNCSFFLEEEEDEETLAVDDDNPDDDDDDDNDSEVPQKRQAVTVSNVLVLVIQGRFDLRRATFAVGPFIHPRLDERSEASYMRFFLSAPNNNDGLRYQLIAHAVCLPGGRVDPIGSDTEEFEQLQVLSRQPPRGAYCINLIDTVSTQCARFSVDFSFAVVYPLAPDRPEEVSLVLSPDGISRSRFHCQGSTILNQPRIDDDDK